MKCSACGVEKDISVLETYPYEDELICRDEPEKPIVSGLECMCLDGSVRVVDICHSCLHRLHPGMWISEAEWESIDPVTPTENLEIVFSPLCSSCKSFSLYDDTEEPLTADRIEKKPNNCSHFLCNDEKGPCPIIKQWRKR